jgi:uncharacterized protein (DUF1015 family)
MAEIKPFRAWRYNEQLNKSIEQLTSPLFDVVSQKQREALYSNPNNSIHISVPLGDDSANTAKKTLENWKSEGIIHQDDLPGIYVYYQHFSLPGVDQAFCRRGFICNIKAYDWDENIVLRHENTMPHSVSDRAEILNATKMNVSATHGLYTDAEKRIEKYMDESMLSPIYSTEDYQGVKDVLSVIQDHNVIKDIMSILKEKQVILADGHHRYEGALAHKNKCAANNPNHSGQEPYNFHMMYLTNTESEDLRILPTHRLVKNIENFNSTNFLIKISEYFHIKPVENTSDINEIILGKKNAFGLMIGEEACKIRLKEEVWKTIDWNFPDEVKELDLTVMHYFVFEKVLGIFRDEQLGSDKITFERNFTTCMSKVLKEEAQIALITNEISMDTVKKVCYSGATMPQKSTYFYPKTICGYLFGSIDETEITDVDSIY